MIVQEIIRDTVITVESDSSMIKALVECDSLGQAHLRELIEVKSGKRIPPPSIKLNNNTLQVKASIDSLAIYLALKDRYTEHRVIETKIDTIEVNRLTTWQGRMYNLGCLSLVVIVCLLGFKLYKLIKPL